MANQNLRTVAVKAAKKVLAEVGGDCTVAEEKLRTCSDPKLGLALLYLGVYHAVQEAKREENGAAFAKAIGHRQERARANEAYSSARFREAVESRFMDRVRLWNGMTLAHATVPMLAEQVNINQTLADGNATRADFYRAVFDRLSISRKECVEDALCDEELLIIRDETKADL